MTLAPQIEGTIPIRSSAAQFIQAVQQRVSDGLLTGHPHPRSNYEVARAEAARLVIRAVDTKTAVNVGLNEVELLLRSGSVSYRIRYWRWAGFVVALSGLLGVIGLVLLLTLDVRSYIARNPSAQLPGLTIDQNLSIAWVMVLFWGFVWPWLLIALHKRPLRQLMARLIAEVDGRAST